MKSKEEEADSELGKRLRAKFEGYKVPGEDRVRKPVFASLHKSSNTLYWILLVGVLVLIVIFFLADFVKTRPGFDKNQPSYLNKNNTENTPVIQSKSGSTKQDAITKDDIQQKPANPFSKSDVTKIKNRNTVQKQAKKIADKQITNNKTPLTLETSHPVTGSNNFLLPNTENTFLDQTGVKPGYSLATATKDLSVKLSFLSPANPLNIPVSLDTFIIPPASDAIKDVIKHPVDTYGIKGVFSASILQTFQLVNLSPSAEDRVQNLRFVPLLSAKSLSYKLTAGIEKKHTQLLVNYTYLRNWNEYELGTNQVVATRITQNQYHMTIIGEKHLEDERSHLLGLGIRQRFMIPRNILRNYSINLGIDYTRLMSQGQDLVWGNVGFYKNIYSSSGTRFDLGPYFQYSFTERRVAQQTWKSRPYQVGILLGVKMK